MTPKYMECNRLKFITIVSVFTLLMLLAHSAAAQTGPALSIVTPADEPVAVQFEAQDDNLVGQLNVMLRNNSDYDQPFIVEFISTTDGTVYPLTSKPDYSAEKLTFFTDAQASPRAEPFSVQPFSFKFGVTKETQLTSVDGVLVVRSDGSKPVQPATLRAKLNIEEAPFSWTDVSFEPDKAYLTVTRWLPLGIGGDLHRGGKASIWFDSEDAALAKQIEETPLSDRLSSDRGDILSLTLSKADEEDGSTKALIKATDITAAGTYEGNLTLDPGAESPKAIPVIARVQDFFVWPLAVLLAGVIVGYFLSKGYDRHRAREILRKALARAGEDYTATVNKSRGCHYTLEKAFPPEHSPFPSNPQSLQHRLGIPQVRAKSSKRNQLNTEAERLYRDVGEARSQEDLDKVSKNINDLVERVAKVPDICKAEEKLRSCLKKFSELPDLTDHKKYALYEAANELLPDKAITIATAGEAARLLSQLTHQADVTNSFVEDVWPLRIKVQKLFSLLERHKNRIKDDEDLEKLFRSDPTHLDETSLYLTKSSEGIKEAIDRLAIALGDLLVLSRKYPELGVEVRQGTANEQALYLMTEGTSLRVPDPNLDRTIALEHLSSEGALLSSEAAKTRTVKRSSAEIIASLRRHDLLVSIAVAFIAAAAFLLTIYPSQSFGSPVQYLGAFIAGASGQVVIDSKIAPWFRSYKAPTGEASTVTKT